LGRFDTRVDAGDAKGRKTPVKKKKTDSVLTAGRENQKRIPRTRSGFASDFGGKKLNPLGGKENT